jgi:hypothetical protein
LDDWKIKGLGCLGHCDAEGLRGPFITIRLPLVSSIEIHINVERMRSGSGNFQRALVLAEGQIVPFYVLDFGERCAGRRGEIERLSFTASPSCLLSPSL